MYITSTMSIYIWKINTYFIYKIVFTYIYEGKLSNWQLIPVVHYMEHCVTSAAIWCPGRLTKFIRVHVKCEIPPNNRMMKCNAPVNWIPGRGGPGWGGDSAPTFCTILHSPRPPRHIFLSLIPAPRGTFFKGALKAHIHISLYENNTLEELLFLSVIPWGEIFAYCHHPAQPLEATGCGHVLQLVGRDHFRPLALCLSHAPLSSFATQ